MAWLGGPFSSAYSCGRDERLDCGVATGMVRVGQILFVNSEPKSEILTIPDAPGFALTLNREALLKSEVTQ
jgi:hypothetical protein